MTGGYGAHISTLRKKNLTKFRRLPTNKRVNYDRLHSPFPFAPNFPALCKGQPFASSYSSVQLLMAGRGTPQLHGYICLPSAEDIAKIREGLLGDVKSIFSHVHTEPLEQEEADIEHIDLKNVKSMSDQQVERHFMGCKTSRRIIGFVTSGGFSYSRSKGFCNGCILREHADLEYYLVRKPSSPHYFLAEKLLPRTV